MAAETKESLYNHPNNRQFLWIRLACALAALLCAVIFSTTSLHWLLVGDASLMHYIVFLVQKGMVPYRDIVDVNLPGSYGIEWLAMHLFGTGSLAWRLFDLAVGVGIGISMTVISWSEDRFAGLTAGAVFLLIHGRDGMNELGQRDLIMTLLLMISTALLLSFLRRPKIAKLIVASTLAGLTATIKPTAIFFWVAMLTYILYRHRTVEQRMRIWLWGLFPFLFVPAFVGMYLIQHHALNAFWITATGLIPFHSHLLRHPATYFFLHPFPSTLLPILLIWFIAIAMRLDNATEKFFSDREALLLVGTLCGLLSFFIQGKALPYHRYPADAFFLLLACLTFSITLKQSLASTARRALAATGLLLCSFLIAPQCLLRTFRLRSSPDDFSSLLQRDLVNLGGPSLNHQVQCIDFTAGCITTLYRMRLEQSTGFLYDCYLFQPETIPVVLRYRSAFWAKLTAAQPSVLVVSNHDCGHPNSFQKIDRWPALATYLQDQYDLLKEVQPPDLIRWASTAVPPYRYRIYLRRKNGPFHQTVKDRSFLRKSISPLPPLFARQIPRG